MKSKFLFFKPKLNSIFASFFLCRRVVSFEYAQKYASDNSINSYIEISCKEMTNIELALNTLVK